MLVGFITIVGKRSETFNPASEAIEELGSLAIIHRVAFGGTTELGRGGVTIDLHKEKVTGHKMEAMPDQLVERVVHFPLSCANHGIRQFADGKDVLIGTEDHGILLKWSGPAIEVYGAGLDTELH